MLSVSDKRLAQPSGGARHSQHPQGIQFLQKWLSQGLARFFPWSRTISGSSKHLN
jgi:hypothetical protein